MWLAAAFACALASACASNLTPLGIDTTTTDATDAVSERLPLGRRERCNGLDDDLDGRIDEGCPIRVTTDAAHDSYPSVSGSRVAWVRFPQTFVGDVGDVIVRDWPSGPERTIARGAAYPWLSGRRVAYLRRESAGGASVIGVYDLEASTEVTITPPDAQFVQAPRLWGDLVMWSQNQRGTEEDYEVYVHDLRTRQTTRLGTHPTIQDFPASDGDWIAWTDDRLGHHTVGLLHLYDVFATRVSMLSSAPVQITNRMNDVAYGYIVAVDRGRVLLDESRGPLLGTPMPRPCAPVLFDLATRVRTPLAPESVDCFRARALSGDWVVLELDPDGASDLYLQHLPSGTRTRLTTYNRRSTRARLDGHLLVWQDDRNDAWDIYAMDLTDALAGDLYPEGVSP